jgi:hypothetical protein
MAFVTPAMRHRLGETTRRDGWWITPAAMALTFLVFVIYATWAAFQSDFYHFPYGVEHYSYLSPFYSPPFQEYFPSVGAFKIFPAFWVVWLPIAFRVTCYYGRKAYYRSLLLSPAACAVGKGKGRGYNGESALPWILNNLHRYFLYLIAVLVVFHWIHFFQAFRFYDEAAQGWKFGMGIGSLVIAADTILLTLYVVSCHSFRHIIGGKVDCFSCARAGELRHKSWESVSKLNVYHNMFFWSSLITVGFADLYIRLCAMGIWTDVRIF